MDNLSLILFNERTTKEHKIKTAVDYCKQLRVEGQNQLALDSLIKVSQIYPNQFIVQLQLGVQYKLLGHGDKAILALTKSSTINPQSLYPVLLLAEIYRSQNNYTDSLAYLIKLKTDHPNNAYVYRALGDHYKDQKLYSEAKQQYVSAGKKTIDDKLYKEIVLEVVHMDWLAGEKDHAIQLLTELIQKYPNYNKIKLKKAAYQFSIANYKSAERICLQIINSNGKYIYSYIILSQIYDKKGHYSSALETIDQGLTKFENNPLLLRQKAELLKAVHDYNQADKIYNNLVAKWPHQEDNHIGLAKLYWKRGYSQLAIDTLNNMQGAPSLKRNLHLIRFYIHRGQLEELNLLFEELKDGTQDYRVDLMRIEFYNIIGQFDKAIALAKNLLEKGPQDVLEEWIGNLYLRKYDYTNSIKHFLKAHDHNPRKLKALVRGSIALMMNHEIDRSYQLLKNGSQKADQMYLKDVERYPIRSHPAVILNMIKLQPLLLARLQQPYLSTTVLSDLVVENPNYIGTALYMIKAFNTPMVVNSKSDPIPQTIIQYWHEMRLPVEVARAANSWIEQNKEYRYVRLSKKTARTFLRAEFPQEYLLAFNNCDKPAMQADLIRLAYLYIHGGYYVDIDNICHKDLSTINPYHSSLVLYKEDISAIGNDFIGAAPKNNIIKRTLDQVVKNINQYHRESPWFQTGPSILTCVVAYDIATKQKNAIDAKNCDYTIMSLEKLRSFILQHLPLPYKRADKSWHYIEYGVQKNRKGHFKRN